MAKPLPTNQLFSLQGKTVICTGATGGIGLEMCKSLGEAGADIVSIQLPNDPNAASISKHLVEIGRNFWAFECDLADTSAIRATFQAIWNAGIKPSVLLNCAGVNRRRPVIETTDEDLDLVWIGGFLTSIEFKADIRLDPIYQPQGYLCRSPGVWQKIDSFGHTRKNNQHRISHFIPWNVQRFCLCKL